ncbi:protein ECT2 isoform X2 [Photinus pyralis]|uniref:protein ECT2 isoform X2 n=1 Tax=Photinus pyralis TaxID=7054 RepID=UPI0012678283|nr:protein ECT2 isoform X2 [Photinus pyralis]
MDEVNARIVNQQSSISIDSNAEDFTKTETVLLPLDKRLCLVGPLAADPDVCNCAQTFGVPVITSDDGLQYLEDRSCKTIYVLNTFDDDLYNTLYKQRQSILGPVALRQLSQKQEQLPDNTRPLFNLSMTGVIVCFTGFRNKNELSLVVPLVHHMGGSIRKDMSVKVTHLIAKSSGGDKYQYAATFKVPVMHQSWVFTCWEQRFNPDFSATLDVVVAEHKLKPFHGAKVCFLGFPEDEDKHMAEVLESNGGSVTHLEDVDCTHVVMEQAEIFDVDHINLSKPASSIAPFLTNTKETLHEDHQNLNNTYFDDTCVTEDLNSTTSSGKRKRELFAAAVNKRRCDLSYSENARRRLSHLLRTPLNYLSRRRQTIGGQPANQKTSSGDFRVETIASCDTRTSFRHKNVKKNLFKRSFKSDKFKRKRSLKMCDLNASNLSEIDGRDSLNNSCFPDFSSYAFPDIATSARNTRESSGVAVVDESTVAERPEISSRAQFVKAEWFWTSVQKQICLDEKEYLFDDYIEQVLSPSARRESQPSATPSSATRRKRKRLQETLSSLALQPSPSVYKRRSSVSDAGLLSVSGSFLDCTASPEKCLNDLPESSPAIETRKALTARQQVVMELVQTESNYVNILNTIMTMFKKHLEDMPEEEALLNNTELKIIFGNLPLIYETHIKMLEELRWTSAHWTEERSIGNIILKYSTDLLKAYPPFVNFFEEMKEMLLMCDANKPRFHAFLKACQTRPECGRQKLQDLLIRPVQRLPSISLLLNDILKHTSKTNSDHIALDQALAALKEVMTHINEDKRKTEGQRVMFDIFNDIDNCPPDLISSHRTFVTRAEVIQLSSSEGLSSKGNFLVLFLFTDQLEVCKKRSKAFNTLKSPNTVNGYHQKSTSKPYKHVKLMPLSHIKRVIDIKETEDCQRVFSLVFRNNDEIKERLFSFAMTESDVDKVTFLKTLCRQMATNACTADADKFLAYLEHQQLDIDTSDINNGTLSKAFKFANRTRLKVGRAFSFNKTPSKLKRAVSSMMSPFGSSTNITPASQLAQMRLASYSNINNFPDRSPGFSPIFCLLLEM